MGGKHNACDAPPPGASARALWRPCVRYPIARLFVFLMRYRDRRRFLTSCGPSSAPLPTATTCASWHVSAVLGVISFVWGGCSIPRASWHAHTHGNSAFNARSETQRHAVRLLPAQPARGAHACRTPSAPAADGQTGSGKTHTMQGPPENPGVYLCIGEGSQCKAGACWRPAQGGRLRNRPASSWHLTNPHAPLPAGLSVRALQALFNITLAEQADGQQRTISVRWGRGAGAAGCVGRTCWQVSPLPGPVLPALAACPECPAPAACLQHAGGLQ